MAMPTTIDAAGRIVVPEALCDALCDALERHGSRAQR
jgi:hypothetical protein